MIKKNNKLNFFLFFFFFLKNKPTANFEINNRDEQKIILRMKGEGSQFFAMNHLPPVIRLLYYFPRPLARAFIARAATCIYTFTWTYVQRRRQSAKVTLTFSRTTLNLPYIDRIIDL